MSHNHRKLPDFIAVGPPRTATTWLHEALKEHVSLPMGIKETNFFAWNFSQGIDWYEAHFRDSPVGRPICEICPVYFDRPEARERIAQAIPGCKIICTLRDPVQRLHSHYRLLRWTGHFRNITFSQALARHRKWSGPGNMLLTGGYASHLKAWRERFGAERVLTLIYDDLERDPQQYVDRLCAFVSIPRIDLARAGVRDETVHAIRTAPRSRKLASAANELRDFLRRRRLYRLSEGLAPFWDFWQTGGDKFEPLDPALEAQLRSEFRPDVEELEKLLDRDLSAWK